MQRMQTFRNFNERPANVSMNITGAQCAHIAKHNTLYFTHSEGILWSDYAHSKTTFDRIKTLQGTAHPSASSAFGYFEYTDVTIALTITCLYSCAGERASDFVLFSSVTLDTSSLIAETTLVATIKYYTMEGNYDLVGLNFPVILSLCLDSFQGPDIIRSQEPSP